MTKLWIFFQKVFIKVLFAIIRLNISKPIYKNFYLQISIYLYKTTLDWLNITYIVKKIK